MAGPEQETLVQRLGRFPVDRYPVQHATTQFHLGSQLLHAGRPLPARDALAVAREVFAAVGMDLETAKATVMLGVAHRASGHLEDAVRAFTDAGDLLASLDQPAETGAAAYNLGLVRQDLGDRDGAHTAWSAAQEAFLAGGFPRQAAAAARDHGSSLLAVGQPHAAVPLLETAAALAERAGDDPGTAAAANVLGLAHLAAGDAEAAIGVLRRALAFVPRAVRPADHAMVRANLALAYEQIGDHPRARLSAGHALSAPHAAAPVRAQAQSLLSRLADGSYDDVLTVLDDEPRSGWVPVIREEATRAAESPRDCRVFVRCFLDGVLARPDASYDLGHALLEVVLQLPPPGYDGLVAAVVDGCARRTLEDHDRLHAVLCSAMARFALPQWQRLAASLNAAADVSGEPATWR